MGCNFVRLAHYPHNENMVREADRLGLMVWSETPVYWTILWENPETFANASNQLAESIARDKNRASIVLWSVANETPVGEARTAFLRKLAAQVRSLDSTRLVTAALLHHNDGGAAQGTTDLLDDPLGADLDVLGCNEYLGWYDGLPDKADHIDFKTIYNKPLIMSEFGADALYGLHGDPLTRWTEEYQENVYRHQVAMLSRIPSLRGTSPWVLMDFRSPRRTLENIQGFFNRKGLVSVRGDKKKAFYVMQEFYQAKRKQYQ
jgi:beta-glucuronidase